MQMENTELSVFGSEKGFELAQRAGKLLSASTLVPKEFQGNTANCVIAINMAQRLSMDPFAVLQHLYIVHGRPSWSAQFMIAMVNASGRYSPLQFRMSGQGDSRACVAWAKHLETGDVVEGPEVSIEMAKKEGWHGKSGSKWISLPDLMLRYRAASFYARLFCPDLCLGMKTAEELTDIGPSRDVTPVAEPGGAMFSPAIDISEPPPTAIAKSVAVTPPDGGVTPPDGEEEVPDSRVGLLQDVIVKITESAAPTPELDREFRERGIFGTKKSSVGRLGVEKLQQIIDEWDAIERAALSRETTSSVSKEELL